MRLSLPFAHRMSGTVTMQDGTELPVFLTPVKQQFRRMKAQIVAGWNINHKPDGNHGDITADTILTTGNDVTGTSIEVHADGVLTPSQITATTNDYLNQGGIEGVWCLRLSTDASRTINGLCPPDTIASTIQTPQEHIRRILIVNVGAQDLVLAHDGSGSQVRYRFICPGSANVTVNANDSVWIHYDVVNQRWRVEGL